MDLTGRHPDAGSAEPAAGTPQEQPGRSLVEAVLNTARQAPDRVAVIEPARRLRYGELVRRAAELAARLAGHGVARADRVALLLDPGTDAVTAVIATLMLGAAYVPIDPQQPMQRTLLMLDRCQARICLAVQATESSACPVIGLDDTDGRPSETPTEPFHADDVAYVIHTSGSTGVPKGVQVEHRSVLNLTAALDGLAPVGPAPVGSWWTRPSFDVSIWESWAPLLHGGTVAVVPDEARLDGARLAEFLSGAGVNTAYVPGAFLPDLIDHLRKEPQGCTELTRLLVGVEPIPLGILQDLMALRPGLTVVNGYGPAETTICCTLYPVPRSGGNRAERTPIGRAVPGNRLHVLGEDGRPSLTGAGELAVAGIGVCRGYLGAAAAESDRFIPEPGTGSGTGTEEGRCYRTGDLVRTLPDGDLVFEGRVDRQLKIRGYRVEPGEVETALRATAALQDVVVGRRDGTDGSPLLAAYVVPAQGTTFDRPTVTARLRELLPAWSVPSAILVLDQIPLTPNGKIDHAALGALPAQEHPGGDRAGHPARTDTERRLVRIWEEVLGVPVLGVRDDFLDLGGHSLTGARICARVREEFGCALTVADLLRATTVEELGALVDMAEGTPGGTADRIPVGAVSPGSRHPLSFAQERMWLLDRMMPGSRDYSLFEAYRLRGPLDAAALRGALGDVVRRQLVLRTTFHAEGGMPFQVVADDAPAPFELIESKGISGMPEEEARDLVERETRRPFRLDTGPLLRMTLLRLAPEHHVLLVVLHHIVADDWSMDVFWHDLCTAYRSRVTGGGAPPAPLRTQYVDYAAWQRGPAYTELLRARLDHWRAELATAPLVLDLPTDFPRAEQEESVDAVIAFSVPPATVRALADVAREARATTYMTLLAVFAGMVAVTAGSEDFTVASFSGQRDCVDLEGLMGMFVNTLALRMRCTGDPTFTELLGRVRSTVLAAFRHQELPFDKLVAALRPPRDLTRHPIAQVGFQSLVTNPDRVGLHGVECSAFASGQGGNPLDLLVTVEEGGEELTGRLHYRPDLFTEATARRLAGRFVGIAAEVAQHPDRRLSELLPALKGAAEGDCGMR